MVVSHLFLLLTRCKSAAPILGEVLTKLRMGLDRDDIPSDFKETVKAAVDLVCYLMDSSAAVINIMAYMATLSPQLMPSLNGMRRCLELLGNDVPANVQPAATMSDGDWCIRQVKISMPLGGTCLVWLATEDFAGKRTVYACCALRTLPTVRTT